jgi:hypothetical protein
MRMIAIVVAALVVVACENTTSGSRADIGFSPTAAIAAQISPQTLPFAVFTSACAVGPVFTTGFDLVIVQTRPVNVFMDRVTLHLLDGTNLGGPSITFPRSQLNAMFGSTLVVGTRAFPFRPQFACGLRRPGSIAADVLLIDAEGSGRSVSVNAAFQ